MNLTEEQRTLETLAILNGDHRRAPSRAAVRIEDLAALLAISQMKSSHAASVSPTTEEFDALVDDVHNLHQQLQAIADVLRVRIR